MDRKTNKAKLEFFKFLRKSAEQQGNAFDKIGGNCALSAYLIKIPLLRYFSMQNSYLQLKQCKILRFS